MKPEAFLPSDSSRPGAASAVPVTPAEAWPAVVARRPAPQVPLSPAQYDEWAAEQLRSNRALPRKKRLELIKWRHEYQLHQEAIELKTNPAAEEELRLIAERLARKAQSGFSSGAPLL